MRAFLKNNRQAPRKVRVVARAMVKKNVSVALAELSFMPQKGASSLKKLIKSAVANAQQKNVNLKEEDLFVKNITVDKGITFSRYMPRAFGRASAIHRECSHIRVELAPVTEAKKSSGDKAKKQDTNTSKETSIKKEKGEKKNAKATK
jgi:large subunit ribosomal protein L22